MHRWNQAVCYYTSPSSMSSADLRAFFAAAPVPVSGATLARLLRLVVGPGPGPGPASFPAGGAASANVSSSASIPSTAPERRELLRSSLRRSAVAVAVAGASAPTPTPAPAAAVSASLEGPLVPRAEAEPDAAADGLRSLRSRFDSLSRAGPEGGSSRGRFSLSLPAAPPPRRSCTACAQERASAHAPRTTLSVPVGAAAALTLVRLTNCSQAILRVSLSLHSPHSRKPVTCGSVRISSKGASSFSSASSDGGSTRLSAYRRSSAW